MLFVTTLLRACLTLSASVPAPPLAWAPVAAPVAAPALVGFWMQEDGAVIEIARQGTANAYVGRYAAFRKDPNTPKAKKLLGGVLLKDLKPDGDKLTGRVIDPDSGKDYAAELVVTDASTMELRVKVIGMVARKVSWKRQASAHS